MKTACILLAAGSGKRFGGDKLNETINGVSLLEHAVCVHMAQDYAVRIAVTAEGRQDRIKGFDSVVINSDPDRGISSTIKLGVEKLLRLSQDKNIEVEQVLFSVSDQPMLDKETVGEILDVARKHADGIIVPVTTDGKRGNPVVFPASLLNEFLTLEGDVGGNRVIKNHEDQVVSVTVSSEALLDVDTKEEFQNIGNRSEN